MHQMIRSSQKRYILIPLIAILGLCFQNQTVIAQLQIAPVAVYMDDNNTTGRIVIRNSSVDPVEVEVDLLFGYPATNEEGKVYFKRYDRIPDDQPSALEWVRVYPRLFELSPGERQTVRFVARPPAGLPDGEYWVRPMVTGQKPVVVEDDSDNNNITTRLNLRQRSILAINYRQGEVGTGITVSDLSVNLKADSIEISANLDRLGNAAYLGHYEIRILDSSGSIQLSERRELAVYHNQKRTFLFDSAELGAGAYTVELDLFTSDRTEGILQASPVSASRSFTLP